jgi:hypothetical protein
MQFLVHGTEGTTPADAQPPPTPGTHSGRSVALKPCGPTKLWRNKHAQTLSRVDFTSHRWTDGRMDGWMGFPFALFLLNRKRHRHQVCMLSLQLCTSQITVYMAFASVCPLPLTHAAYAAPLGMKDGSSAASSLSFVSSKLHFSDSNLYFFSS